VCDERAAALARAGVVQSLHVAPSRVELLAHLLASVGSGDGSDDGDARLVVVAHDPPWIDGIELARLLDRVEAPGSPAASHVVVVDLADATAAIDALRAGVAGVLLAPCGTAELVATVVSVVAGSCVVPPTAAGRLVASTPRPTREQLSARELEVLRALSHGLTNGEIATALYVSRETVKTHVAHVLRKLGVGDRHAAVARARALGLLVTGEQALAAP
jgi:DNA-binding NarL/FixJ family response regulator